MPFLPVMPVRKCCAVYNLRFHALHGMEEVIGSIPVRSTKKHLKIKDIGCHTPVGYDLVLVSILGLTARAAFPAWRADETR